MNPKVAKPELLCPAGDRSRLEAAVRYGADAVYLGASEFGMRAAPRNFSFDDLAEAVEFAHAHNVKVHVTVNTMPRPDETPRLPDFLRRVGETGVDALIIADFGILTMARDLLPDMELHASTQTGIFNELTANALGALGVRRVVLARELSLDEIRVIRERTDPSIELETFIHGAMCMSVSGRCTISNFLVDRDANRGACAQPCRWNYYLMEEKRPDLYLPIVEDEHGTTILSARDLCMIEHLRELADAGISSFKIEGRAKTAYYVAVVTNAYRAALDAMAEGKPFPAWTLHELDTISHREYSTGFYYGRGEQSYHPGGYVQDWEIAAIALSAEDGYLTVSERNRFYDGETLELLEPGLPPREVPVSGLQTPEGEPLSSINHPNAVVRFPFAGAVQAGAVLRRKKQQNA